MILNNNKTSTVYFNIYKLIPFWLQLKQPITIASFKIGQMNIFNANKRSARQSLVEPPNLPGNGDDQKTQKYIIEEHQQQKQKFTNFLTNHYAKFDFKINKCKLNCIKTANNYQQISQCQKKCSSGVMKFSDYINKRIDQMSTLLNQCVQQGSKLPNSLAQVYRCHHIYNKGFYQLKLYVQEESMFYQ